MPLGTAPLGVLPLGARPTSAVVIPALIDVIGIWSTKGNAGPHYLPLSTAVFMGVSTGTVTVEFDFASLMVLNEEITSVVSVTPSAFTAVITNSDRSDASRNQVTAVLVDYPGPTGMLQCTVATSFARTVTIVYPSSGRP